MTSLPFFFSFFPFFLSLFFLPLLPSSCVSLLSSFCRFVVFRFVSFIAFFPFLLPGMFFSIPCFPWWRIMLVCYLVSVLHAPRAACEPELCVYPLCVVFFLAILQFFILFFFSSFPFSTSIWTSFVHPVFFLWALCCLLGFGFCCDSFSVRYAS